MSKKFSAGFMIGRFQPFHKGHKFLVETLAELCDVVVIAVGSAQESNTKRNPLSYEFREELIVTECKDIEEKYGVRLVVVPVKDMKSPDNHTVAWGNYLLSTIRTELLYREIDVYPDIVIYGNEPERSKWYDMDSGLTEILVNRDRIGISSTFIRNTIYRYGIEFNYTEFFREHVAENYSNNQIDKIISKILENE